MKIYAVHIGWKIDHYGYATNYENIRYFLNKDKALEFYKTGEHTYKITQITTRWKDGTTTVGYTGASFYKQYLKNACPNEVIELVDKTDNYYVFEEIEVE